MSRSIAKLKNDTKIITSIFRDDFNQIIAVTLFGFLIRFYGLNQNGFSWDELLVLLNAKQPFASINTFTPPPFFTYILHLVYIFGGSDSFFRVLPAAIGAAIVPVLYKIVHQRQGHEAAIWGAFLVALSPLQITYSQDLSMYTLLMLEALLALFFWDRLLEKGNPSDYVGYSVCMVMGFFTHPWFAFAYLAQMVWLFFFTPVDRTFRMGLYGVLTVGLVMMELHPEAFFFFYTPYFSWLKLPGLSDAVKTVQVFLFGIAPPFGSWGSMTPASLNSLFILMILALAGGLFAMSGPWMKRGRIFFAGLLGPLALGFGYSYLITPVYYADRYSLIAYPAFIITLCGIFAARTRWVRYVSRFACVLYCLVCATQLACYFTNFEKAPWQDIAGVIESLPEPRAVDTSGLSLIDRQTLRYYMPSTPEWEGAHFWWKNFTDSPLGTQTHLAIPIKTWYTGNIKDTLPPAWRVDRIVYINDAVIYILKKLPAIPAAGALTKRG